MLYAMPARSSHQRFAGLAVVAAFHVVLFYMIANGMVRIPTNLDPLGVKFYPKPDVKPESPPTPTPVKVTFVNPDLPQVPPPFVPVAPSQPSITVQVSENPRTDPMPPRNDATGNRGIAITNNVGVACPNSQAVRTELVYPMAARREGVQGDVLARFVVGAAGQIRDITIVQSANRLLNPSVISALRRFECVGQGADVTVEVPFVFRLN